MARIWGKVVGGALGFILGGGPMGAVLGMAAGHAYDAGEAALLAWPKELLGGGVHTASPEAVAKIYTQSIVVLGAKLAKADGRVTRAEIDAFKRAFKITPEQEDSISQMFDKARRSAEGYEPYAFQLAQHFRNQPVVLENILYGLFIVAASDSVVISQAEARYLKTISFIFNFSPDQLNQIAAKANVRIPLVNAQESSNSNTPPGPGLSALAVLGLTDKASDAEIKSAYRKLIRKFHPDQLVAEGKPPTMVAAANEKMKAINAAYDEVSRLRGIK